MKAEITIGLLAAGGALAIIAARQRLRAVLSRLGPKWTNLHPDVRTRAELVLIDANAEFETDGLAVGVHQGWRTIDQQQKEIAEGDSFVSHALRSFHPWGLAVDFVFIDKAGRWTWLPDPANAKNREFVDPRWHRLGAIIERHGFKWGGRFRTVFDGPHAELGLEKTNTLISRFGGFDQWQTSWA